MWCCYGRRIRQLECELAECKRHLWLPDDTQLLRMYECKVCFERTIDTVLLPCGHALLCAQCAADLPKRSCPACELPIETTTLIRFL